MPQTLIDAGTSCALIALAVAGLLWLVPEQLSAADDPLTWTDARELTVDGKGWTDTASFYDRLPAKAKGVVRDPVWDLSHNSAGYCIRFTADTPVVHVKWDLTSAGLAMEHMPATGVSGVDLYWRDAKGAWRFVGNGRPSKQLGNEATFYTAGYKDLALYLPLYNGVTSVSIGVPAGKPIARLDAVERPKPVLFYGTSITQGGCASRPGMAATAIVGRKLDMPVINLGFSGNGQMEPEMADLLAELDPSVYVLDALWNMSPEMVTERVAPFVHKLRAARPTTPILLAEDCTIHGNTPTPKGKVLRDIFAKLKAEGVTGLYFVSADGMMGPDDEGTVDGCHPTDLGFMYQADVFVRALKPILAR
jgi:hypothetical protein